MAKNLVIVESPAKAKTIEGYLGKDFKVASSYGHIRDLPKDDKAIDISNNFNPTYEIPKDKKEVIKTLRELVKDAELVFLASDDDREGEAISWHLKEALKLDDARVRRIVFREITKSAIEKAMQNPRGIDLDLVNAQVARRVLDRLVGFELSPVLWRKIKTGLSAGRVQSVAVRLVVEREREIDAYQSKASFKVTALFELSGGQQLKAELPKKFDQESEAINFLEQCKDAEFTIRDLQKKPVKKSPAPPFTTSTLQQEASRKLGYSVSKTMTLAQKLYESGKISYMRTDSVNLSQEAIQAATALITSQYGREYSESRQFKTKSASAQEAHEAIRPTDFSLEQASDDANAQKLYELIRRRAIASQMAEARLERTTVSISVSTSELQFIAQGEVIKFDGFLKVYIASSEDDENGNNEETGVIPPLQAGDILDRIEITVRQVFSRPPARYTEATLVKKLEEMGIGRPSTYAPTISTIQKRDYVVKESRPGKERQFKTLSLTGDEIKSEVKTEITGAENKKLFPTNTAMVVNDFLVEHFPKVTNYSFTAEVEKDFDEIAQGHKEWHDMIAGFYGSFHEKIESSKNLARSEVGKVRELGIDPETGKTVYARLGKYGPVVQLGEISEDESAEKPKFASMRNGQFIEKITLEEALDLFKLPRELGQYEDEMMIASIGKFGPYIRHRDKFYSIPKVEDPYTVTADRAVEIIQQKRKDDAERIIRSFTENPDVLVLKGRYGPYIKVGKQNVRIPKDKDPESLTLEECLDLAEKAASKKASRGKK